MTRISSRMLIRLCAVLLLLAASQPSEASTAAALSGSPERFIAFIKKRLAESAAGGEERKFVFDCDYADDPLARRVLAEYGAMFSAVDSVVLPPKCVFQNSSEVSAFQGRLNVSARDLSGRRIELQAAAQRALDTARNEAAAANAQISPVDDTDAAKRDYNDSARIWSKRFFPALQFWVRAGAIGETEAVAALNEPLAAQARRVLAWETRGFNFGTGRSRSIFSSAAPPGTSQHLSLLAFDTANYGEAKVRTIMNANGWFQTVIDDPAHFTFLGVSENELPGRGLKPVRAGNFIYWLPDMTDENIKPRQITVSDQSQKAEV